MVWVLEKKVIHHALTLGFDTVDTPVGMRFEFEVKNGTFVPGSLSTNTLYNRDLIQRRYPASNVPFLELSTDETVEKEIRKHLHSYGLLDENDEGFVGPHAKR